MQANQGIVTDGILVASKWNSTAPKILFLLKESTKRSEWTEIAGKPINTRDGDNPRFWPNVLRWKHAVYGIFNEHRVPPYPSVEETKERRINNGLLDEIAYVNVNKKLGETKSNNAAITRIAFENRIALAEQIDKINPNVVFCCGTFEAYEAIYTDTEIEELGHSIFVHNSPLKKQRFVIKFCHPSYWTVGPEDLYRRLSDILSQRAFINRLEPTAVSIGSPPATL